MRTQEELEQAMQVARQAWKDTGDPHWACVEGALAWTLGLDVASWISERLEA
jgi:hypothetical protein